jgi:hypothetical protein
MHTHRNTMCRCAVGAAGNSVFWIKLVPGTPDNPGERWQVSNGKTGSVTVQPAEEFIQKLETSGGFPFVDQRFLPQVRNGEYRYYGRWWWEGDVDVELGDLSC